MESIDSPIRFLQKMIEEDAIKEHLQELNTIFARNSPMHKFLGLVIEKLHKGYAEATYKYSVEHSRIGGMLHGGIVTALLDQVMGTSALTVNPGNNQVTLELKINFLKPMARNNSPFKIIGKVIRVGRKTMVCEGKIVDKDGEVCAVALGTWYIIYNILR